VRGLREEELSVAAQSEKLDPQARIDAAEIIEWAERLHVTPEELRSAVQQGGTMVKDVVAELERLSQRAPDRRRP
jgi:uncharacterized protein DUF3606